MACCPIAKGAVTGCYHRGEQFEKGDMRNGSTWFSDETMERYNELLTYLASLGREMNVTLGQLSLAWILGRKPWIVPIPGTTKLSHLEENLRTLNFTLSPEEWKELEDTVAAIPVVGDRYNAEQQRQVGF